MVPSTHGSAAVVLPHRDEHNYHRKDHSALRGPHRRPHLLQVGIDSHQFEHVWQKSCNHFRLVLTNVHSRRFCHGGEHFGRHILHHVLSRLHHAGVAHHGGWVWHS